MRIPPFLFYLGSVIFILGPAILMTSGSDHKGASIGNLIFANGFLTFAVVIFGGIGFIVVSNYRYNKSEDNWKSGVFDHRLAYSEDALLQAYIRLGGLMLRKDQDDMKGKMAYLHRYFDQHFMNNSIDLIFALKASFQHPVDLQSITPWLKKNLPSTSQRSQLLYFLAGLSTVDGTMNPKEKRYLTQLSDLLDLSKKDFDSIMAMYSKYEDAYHDQFKQRHRAPRKPKSQYKREKASEILGVSVQASADEIKKAYRSLAKVHHPDRFATQSQSQQIIAKERFVKIQLAYELLMEFKN